MNFFKKLTLGLTMLVAFVTVSVAQVINTEVFTTNEVRLITTNNWIVSAVTVAAGEDAAVNVDIFNLGSAITNTVITDAFTNRIETVEDVITTNVSPLTGITNLSTNSILVISYESVPGVTSAAPYTRLIVAANDVATFDVDLINSKGTVYRVDTNATVTTTFRRQL